MDIADSLLSALDVDVDPFAICDVRVGSHLDLKPDKLNSIHYVLFGSSNLLTSQGHSLAIEADQMIIIPRGMSHSIESTKSLTRDQTASAVCLQPSTDLEWLQSGDGSSGIVLACGHIRASYGQNTDIFSLLDSPLVVSFSDSDNIRGAFERMLSEFCHPQLGTLALTSSLMKQCLILLLRRMREEQDWRVPWLAVLDNRGLQNSLKAILDEPERNFKVDELADIAFMSRSSFSKHFTDVLGQPPHEFQINYKLRRAAMLLKTTSLPVEKIANSVGYSSRSSFSRAFKSLFKEDPAGYRKISS